MKSLSAACRAATGPSRLRPSSSAEAPGPPAWGLRPDGERTVLDVGGDWIAQAGRIPSLPPDALATRGGHATLCFDATKLGEWDSGLIAFLWDAKREAAAADVDVDGARLPAAARRLLELLPGGPQPSAPAPRPRTGVLASVGGGTVALLAEIGSVATLLTATARAGALAPFGRTRIRGADLVSNLRDAGPSALVIVSVVNFLIGAILAFIGAAQLRRFAADAYVADLVGLALVREMAPVMTAIVMAGRTGGAYAARIATMEGNEEIDALTVIGIPAVDYIVLPAIPALVLTMPFLYLYGCLIGIVGGLAVASAMLTVTGSGYLHQTFDAVPLGQFVFGFCKSVAFALLIGVTSCRVGLKAGRSSADVGTAATRAVVTGIVGVIVLDALFAVFADAIGI